LCQRFEKLFIYSRLPWFLRPKAWLLRMIRAKLVMHFLEHEILPAGKTTMNSQAMSPTWNALTSAPANWLIFFLACLLAHGCSVISTASRSSVQTETSAPALIDKDAAGKDANLQKVTIESDTPKSKTPPSNQKHVLRGEASWYGPRFHGKKTASGEIFDQTKFTAAHKTLPLGSRARVTNISNGSSVEVEINDRGPFVEGRILDVSRAAAHALGFISAGTAPVRLELLDQPLEASAAR
jgi:rare lipoprotein A (peptidoglycan hydrolase)